MVIFDLLLSGKRPILAAFACLGPCLESGVDYHNPCVSLTRARAEVYSSTSNHLGISGSGDLGIWRSGISGSEDLRILGSGVLDPIFGRGLRDEHRSNPWTIM